MLWTTDHVRISSIMGDSVHGVMVKASDLRSSGRGFDSRPGRYMYPSVVGKSSTGLVGWGYGRARSLVSGGR